MSDIDKHTTVELLRGLEIYFIEKRTDQLRAFAFDDFLQWLRSKMKHGQYSNEQFKLLREIHDQAWKCFNERMEDLGADV